MNRRPCHFPHPYIRTAVKGAEAVGKVPRLNAGSMANTKRCRKCACNPNSPERADVYGWCFLKEGWQENGAPFYCHESVPGHFQEVKDRRPRWRLCAGWLAEVGSVEAALSRSSKGAEAAGL